MSPRAAMIAQDFARVGVLGALSRGARGETPRKRRDTSIAVAYGAASMCVHAGKRPARARQRGLLPARTSKMECTSLKCNELYSFNKRLGEICGLICFDLSRSFTELPLRSPCGSLLLARWACGREARECGRARWATRVQRVVRGPSTRPEGRAPVRRTRPHAHRARTPRERRWRVESGQGRADRDGGSC